MKIRSKSRQTGQDIPSDISNNALPDRSASELRLMRLKEVMAVTGLSRSSIYAYVSRDTFPAQVQLGPRCVAWRASDVQEWILSLKTTGHKN